MTARAAGGAGGDAGYGPRRRWSARGAGGRLGARRRQRPRPRRYQRAPPMSRGRGPRRTARTARGLASAPMSTEHAAAPHVPVCLSIAGSDSGGGAGIQADLKAFARCGVHGATAITALTAQNTVAVTAVAPTEPDMVVAQIEAVAGDLGVDAVKIGMLGGAPVIEAVARALDALPDGTPVVLDPVMIAESGARLLPTDAEQALVELLLPRATVITPNVPEARVLAAAGGGVTAQAAADLDGAPLARAVRAAGANAVVVTGGHPGQAAARLPARQRRRRHRRSPGAGRRRAADRRRRRPRDPRRAPPRWRRPRLGLHALLRAGRAPRARLHARGGGARGPRDRRRRRRPRPARPRRGRRSRQRAGRRLRRRARRREHRPARHARLTVRPPDAAGERQRAQTGPRNLGKVADSGIEVPALCHNPAGEAPAHEARSWRGPPGGGRRRGRRRGADAPGRVPPSARRGHVGRRPDDQRRRPPRGADGAQLRGRSARRGPRHLLPARRRRTLSTAGRRS